jgi:(1->4)-alpha-D-glucan 1-alpha-D-glucosylmutase
VLKALREAKLNTSRVNPSTEYESATRDFVTDLLEPAKSGDALRELTRFVGSIADAGFMNGLAQTVVKICAPGVPDFYRGTELWDFCLVDPDNRRPVDYQLRQEWLHELRDDFDREPQGLASRLVKSWPDPRIKLFTIWRLLRLRRERQDVFQLGSYVPLEVRGPHAEHVVAFARMHGEAMVIAVVPRLTQRMRLAAAKSPPRGAGWRLDWHDTEIVLPSESPSALADVFTTSPIHIRENKSGEAVISVQSLLQSFPIAALSNQPSA